MEVPADRTRNRSLLGDEVKTTKFPRTSRRQERIERVLRRRQPTLTVVLEDVHDMHNASAVLRACDAVGVLDIHLVYVFDDPPPKAFHRATSGSAAKWVRAHFHESIESCYEALRADDFRIYATALRDNTRDLYGLDLAGPMAFVFGNEHRGVSDTAVDLADGTVGIPMMGMVESLNISVACAVSLYEAMRQRRDAGMYNSPQLDSADLKALNADWVRK